jgi:hypothetical protein
LISFSTDDVFIITTKNPQIFIDQLEAGELNISNILYNNIDSKAKKMFADVLIKCCTKTACPTQNLSVQPLEISGLKHLKLNELIPESIIAIAGTSVQDGQLGRTESATSTGCVDCVD